VMKMILVDSQSRTLRRRHRNLLRITLINMLLRRSQRLRAMVMAMEETVG
jgi:hypothetical protein